MFWILVYLNEIRANNLFLQVSAILTFSIRLWFVYEHTLYHLSCSCFNICVRAFEQPEAMKHDDKSTFVVIIKQSSYWLSKTESRNWQIPREVGLVHTLWFKLREVLYWNIPWNSLHLVLSKFSIIFAWVFIKSPTTKPWAMNFRLDIISPTLKKLFDLLSNHIKRLEIIHTTAVGRSKTIPPGVLSLWDLKPLRFDWQWQLNHSLAIKLEAYRLQQALVCDETMYSLCVYSSRWGIP